MYIHDDVRDSRLLAPELKSMEYPTLKVPYEILNKKYRTSQKIIDREVSYLSQSLQESEMLVQSHSNANGYQRQSDEKNSSSNISQEPEPAIGVITKLFDGVVDKLGVLKRKADDSLMDEQGAAQVCKRRLEHLKDGCYNATNEISFNAWKKKRLDRMLVDYLLRNGYYESAIKLARHSNIGDITNIELFIASRQVEDSLMARETDKCLAWCHENRSKLRKIKSTLEIQLRQQEFIELIRQRDPIGAIKHARKYFPSADETQQQELQHVMGMLAFPNDRTKEPYRSLLADSRLEQLKEQFRRDNYTLFGLNSVSVFSVVLHAGLSVLKTPHCYKKSGDRNPECPICGKMLNDLAKELPYPHCSRSKLICAITGEPLNEYNTPLMLPNGYVYGEIGLKSMAEKNQGSVICPRTHRKFKLSEAEKVYVM